MCLFIICHKNSLIGRIPSYRASEFFQNSYGNHCTVVYDCELEYPETKSGFFKSTTDNTIVMHINSSVMRVNGEDAEIDPGRGTAAVIKDSRTLVPIRAIIESFGGSADWNGDENKVTLKLGKNKL